MSRTNGRVKRKKSKDRDFAMRLFNIEFLGEDRFSVERDDGTVFQGNLAMILPMLNFKPLTIHSSR